MFETLSLHVHWSVVLDASFFYFTVIYLHLERVYIHIPEVKMVKWKEGLIESSVSWSKSKSDYLDLAAPLTRTTNVKAFRKVATISAMATEYEESMAIGQTTPKSYRKRSGTWP